jgi:cell division septal protein FtsQ
VKPARPAPAAGKARRRRIAFGALGLVAGLGLLFGGRAGLRHLGFFSVRRIELVGAQYLQAATVAEALKLRPGANLFDPKNQFLARVKALPGVIDATVSRRIPGTLRIRVREAEPVALAERGDKLVLVDERGLELPFDPAKTATDLPVAVADPVVAGLLGRIRDQDPALFGRIQRGARIRGDVVLDLEQGRLFLKGSAEPADIEALSLVAGLLAREGRAWRELDGRYPPRVVVRGSGPA